MDTLAAKAAAYIAQFMFIGTSFKPGGKHNFGSIANSAWRIAHANLLTQDAG